jgi:beta propeller repeat protein
MALLLVGMIASGSMVSLLSPSVEAAWTPAGQEEELYYSSWHTPYGPEMSDFYIVWHVWDGSDFDVYYHDLFTGQSGFLNLAGNQVEPSTSNVYVAYADDRNGNWDIYVMNLRTLTEYRITTDTNDQRDPSMSGTRVAYEDNRNGNWDIYMSTGLTSITEVRMTTDVTDQLEPQLYSSTVVYQSMQNGNWDIYTSRESLGTVWVRSVETNPSNQFNPDIYDGTIVWEDARDGPMNIYGRYNTLIGVPITTRSGVETKPSVYLENVVYQIWNGKDYDVYIQNLETGIERQVTWAREDQTYPVIYKDLVVYLDYRRERHALYMTTLDMDNDGVPDSVDDFPTNPAEYNDRDRDGIGDVADPDDNNNGIDDDQELTTYLRGEDVGWVKRLTHSERVSDDQVVVRGDRVAYVSWDFDASPYRWTVNIMNVTSGTNTALFNQTKQILNMDWDGDILVWEEATYSGWISYRDVFMYNVSNSTRTELFPNAVNRTNPSVHGDIIVWQDDRNGNLDVYMYNVSNETGTRVTHGAGHERNPSIYGDLITYESYDTYRGWDVMLYSISKGTATTEVGSYDDQTLPRVDGRWLSYLDDSANGNDVWILDHDRNKKLRLTHGYAMSPVVADGRVVWSQHMGPERNVIMYDIERDEYVWIAPEVNNQGGAAVSAEMVVWGDNRYGLADLYVLVLDRDHDGVMDSRDAFPDNPTDWADTDGDGIGDNADPDADGDGTADADQVPSEVATRLDGIDGDLSNITSDVSTALGQLGDLDTDLTTLTTNVATLASSVNQLSSDLQSARAVLSNQMNGLSSSLSSARSSIEGEINALDALVNGVGSDVDDLSSSLDDTETSLMGAIADVNDTLASNIVSSVDTITAQLVAMNSSLVDDLMAARDALMDDNDAMESWLDLVIKGLEAELVAVNASLAAKIDKVETDIGTFYTDLTMDLVEVMVALSLVEANLTVAESTTQADIAALSTLVTELNHQTLDDLSESLDGLAADIGDHDAYLAEQLSDMADRVRRFEVNISTETDEIDTALEELSKLETIIVEVEQLDSDLAQAQSDIEDQVTDAGEATMGVNILTMVLLIVVLIMSAVMLLMLLKMRSMEPMEPPRQEDIEPVILEDL